MRALTVALAATPPGGEQAVEIRYRVRFPRGFPVAGLE